MKCEDVQNCQGAYLDSELDGKTTLEIQEHLKTCPECAHVFSQHEKLESWMKTALNRDQESRLLWEKIERAVMEEGQVKTGGRPKKLQRCGGWGFGLAALGDRVRAGLAGSRLIWTGLAAAWLVILVLNSSANGAGPKPTDGHEALSASDMRFALNQKKTLLVELAAPTEPGSAAKTKFPAGPRSERRPDTSNT